MANKGLNTIGERIRFLRKKECLMTQVEFAEQLGVTNAHISKIEKGLTMPSEALIKLMCKSFNVSEHWIKDGLPPMYEEEIEDEADENMTIATRQLNKLLNDEDLLIRLTTSQLEMSFVQMVNIDYVNEKSQIQYLKTLLHLLHTINDTLQVFKTTYPISENVEREIMQNELKDIEGALQSLIKMITDSH